MEPSTMPAPPTKNPIQKLWQDKKFRFASIGTGLILVAIAGTIVLRLSFANTTTTTTNADCGKKVNPYNYQVPFGNAAWNQPVCNLPRLPQAQSDDYANRLYEHGRKNDGSAAALANRGKVNVSFGMGDPRATFSRAVYFI